MAGVRRSGRIAKEIAILLTGTDVAGRVISEETKTVLLSRHGAGVLSRCKFSADEPMTVRILGTESEASVRLVGTMGTRVDGQIYGIAFKDPCLDFWELPFPPPPPKPPEGPAVLLECAVCRQTLLYQQCEIEADVFAVSDYILRHCGVCGMTTHWKHAAEEPKKLPVPRVDEIVQQVVSNNQLSVVPTLHSSSSQPSASTSFYSGESTVALLAATVGAAVGILPEEEKTSVSSAADSEESPSGVRRKNRRRDVRTGVGFTARIRHGVQGDDFVECENVSKGGFCFRSRKRYEMNSPIEAAVPYSPGEQAIFVEALIQRVQELPAAKLFRYGAAYVKSRSVVR